jgi:hypothetical protein
VENSLEFANDMFGTHPNVDYRNSGPKMVCFYAGKPSEHPQINKPEYAYQDDGIYFQKLDRNTLIDNLVNKNDWGKSNRVVGFTVDMGLQNQNVFTNISVSQDNGKPTSETLQQLNDMANQAGNRKTSTQNVSLYNLYKTRSYGCTIQMMGNAMIQPMMYFNLRHVPMFAGSYMILGVNHTITPGNFTTQFEGVRQSIFSLPDVDSYIQGILTNLVNTVFSQVKQPNSASGGNSVPSQNTPQEKQKQLEDAKKIQLSPVDSCPRNSRYQDFQPITTPQNVTLTFKETIDKLTGYTFSPPIENKVKTKLNYTMWCLMWINNPTQTGFEGYESNFANLRLDLKINKEEVQYGPRNDLLTKNYFCASDEWGEMAFATFGSPEDFIKFGMEYLKDKLNTALLSKAEIKDSQGKINNIDKLSEDMDRLLFTSWPVNNTSIDYETISKTQQCKDRIKSIKSAIQQAQILGL